jgi:hypothetical protein
LEKARRLRPIIVYRYNQEHEWWEVKSTTSTEWYAIFRYQWQPKETPPFHIRVGCTCKASQHVIPICYHKAFVYILLQEGELGQVA